MIWLVSFSLVIRIYGYTRQYKQSLSAIRLQSRILWRPCRFQWSDSGQRKLQAFQLIILYLYFSVTVSHSRRSNKRCWNAVDSGKHKDETDDNCCYICYQRQRRSRCVERETLTSLEWLDGDAVLSIRGSDWWLRIVGVHRRVGGVVVLMVKICRAVL